MKIVILGAGKQAQGVAYYLSLEGYCDKFVCYDISKDNLLACEKYAGNKGDMRQLDISRLYRLLWKIDECDGVINTLPYALMPETTRMAIIAGKPMVDLGGNDEVFAKQKTMHHLAIQTRTTIVPACGLAPGIISDIAFNAKKYLSETNNIRMFCGGLPQKPEGELQHALFFNEEGLYNEYAEKPVVIKNGKVFLSEPLCKQEDVRFSHEKFCASLESALTHGAFDADPSFWQTDIYYATLRYHGHFDKIRELIKTLPRDQCIKEMKKKMGPAGKDVIALQVKVSGKINTTPAIYTCELLDFFDEKTGLSAMQRCTAFPATETLLQILSGNWPKGIVRHEQYVDMERMTRSLLKHGINIGSYTTAHGDINT